MEPKRVALYARVSTKTHGQDVETQLEPMRAYALHRGFIRVTEYADVGISGGKERRPELDRLMKAARLREFDVVLVARFDRFARSSMHLATALGEFQALGIDFISMNESVDTSTPMGKMVFSILAAVAELEHSVIRERVQAGVDRAIKAGVKWGRPKVIFDREKVRELSTKYKMSTREIATQLGVSKDTIRNFLNGKLK